MGVLLDAFRVGLLVSGFVLAASNVPVGNCTLYAAQSLPRDVSIPIDGATAIAAALVIPGMRPGISHVETAGDTRQENEGQENECGRPYSIFLSAIFLSAIFLSGTNVGGC
jgi:hypothetical protein